MERSNDPRLIPALQMLRDLVNKLAVISGQRAFLQMVAQEIAVANANP
jgi:hypothetical protein